MTNEKLYEVLGDINEKHVKEAREYRKAKKPIWIKWTAMAACLCLVLAGLFPIFNRPGVSPFVLTAYALDGNNAVSAAVMQEGESVPASMFETESGIKGFVFSYDNTDPKQASSISVMTDGPFPGVINEIVGLNLEMGKHYLFHIPVQSQEAPYGLMIPHTENNTVYEFYISIDKVDDGYMATIEQIVSFEQKPMP